MIARLCLGLTLPLALTAVQQENLPAGWSVYTSKEGAFSVALPGKPGESKQRVMTATGNLDVYLFVVETKDDAAYVVSYSDLPAAEIKAGTADKRLDHARDGAVDNARGKLRSEKKIEIASFPGRELVIETGKDVVIKMRIFAVNKRLYQTMAMGSGAFFQSKDAGQFLDSLKLIK
jgi:hypothetical protein